MTTASQKPIALFAPAATLAFGASLAAALDSPLCPPEQRVFTGGEYRLRALENVRDRSVYVVQSLFGDALGSANDRLCQLLFFIGSLKDAGAGRVTACVPYFAYARQDRRSEARDPLSLRYVAKVFEAVGVDRILALDVHDLAAFENAFRCETVHLEAAAAFAARFAGESQGRELAVASPDIGGAKRARHFQELLQAATGRTVNFALMDKTRKDGRVSGSLFAGDVAGRQVIVFDDLIDSGATVLRAIGACRRAGAARVDVAATHASFAPEAQRLFGPGTSDAERPDSVIVTDSVALGAGFAAGPPGSLRVLPVAPAFATAIRGLE